MLGTWEGGFDSGSAIPKIHKIRAFEVCSVGELEAEGNDRGMSFRNIEKRCNLESTPLKINILKPKMKVWKMIFLLKQVIFRFLPLIFQGLN